MAGELAVENWHDLFLRLYSRNSYPADWAFLLRFCETANLDAEDIAFAAAIWDMNDRVGASELTPSSCVGLAFSSYFGTAREQRTLEKYLKLITEMQDHSRKCRAALVHKNIKVRVTDQKNHAVTDQKNHPKGQIRQILPNKKTAVHNKKKKFTLVKKKSWTRLFRPVW